MTTQTDLTPASIDLFKSLVKMAPDWSGSPLVEVTRQERGNLTDLKVKGLLTTQDSDGCMFANFLPAGVALATELGLAEYLADYR